MNRTKFSIIIPIYNRESTIEDTINSVLKQTWPKWELLLIDDGSYDLTGDICKSFSSQDERIWYFRKENGGVSTARNFGINKATGDYLVFLDSDNSMVNNMLERLNEVIRSDATPDIVVFGFNTSITSSWHPTENNTEIVIERDIIRKLYLPTHFNIFSQDNCFLENYVWNKAYRLDFIKENSISFDYSRRIWEDGIFVIDCLDHANRISILPDAIYNAYCEKIVDHLSECIYADQVLQYIQDEENYYNRFGKELDFSTDHYFNSNISVINKMFERIVHKYGKDAKLVISKAINAPIVQFWAHNYNPSDKITRKLKQYVLQGNSSRIISLYSISSFKGVVKKEIKSISRVGKH